MKKKNGKNHENIINAKNTVNGEKDSDDEDLDIFLNEPLQTKISFNNDKFKHEGKKEKSNEENYIEIKRKNIDNKPIKNNKSTYIDYNHINDNIEYNKLKK